MVLLFAWAATIGASFGGYALAAEILVDNDISPLIDDPLLDLDY